MQWCKEGMSQRMSRVLIILLHLSLTHYKHFFMTCRVSGTQWTRTISPTKLVSGDSQWVTPRLFLSSSNSHTPAPLLCPLYALHYLVNWIMIAINAGKCCFCDPKTYWWMPGHDRITLYSPFHKSFSLARDPWPADVGVKRASCPGEREPVWLSPGSQLHITRLLILYQMSERSLSCHIVILCWYCGWHVSIYFYQSIKWSLCLVGIVRLAVDWLVKYLSLDAGLGSSGDMGTLQTLTHWGRHTEVTHAVTMRAVTV